MTYLFLSTIAVDFLVLAVILWKLPYSTGNYNNRKHITSSFMRLNTKALNKQFDLLSQQNYIEYDDDCKQTGVMRICHE